MASFSAPCSPPIELFRHFGFITAKDIGRLKRDPENARTEDLTGWTTAKRKGLDRLSKCWASRGDKQKICYERQDSTEFQPWLWYRVLFSLGAVTSLLQCFTVRLMEELFSRLMRLFKDDESNADWLLIDQYFEAVGMNSFSWKVGPNGVCMTERRKAIARHLEPKEELSAPAFLRRIKDKREFVLAYFFSAEFCEIACSAADLHPIHCLEVMTNYLFDLWKQFPEVKDGISFVNKIKVIYRHGNDLTRLSVVSTQEEIYKHFTDFVSEVKDLENNDEIHSKADKALADLATIHIDKEENIPRLLSKMDQSALRFGLLLTPFPNKSARAEGLSGTGPALAASDGARRLESIYSCLPPVAGGNKDAKELREAIDKLKRQKARENFGESLEEEESEERKAFRDDSLDRASMPAEAQNSTHGGPETEESEERKAYNDKSHPSDSVPSMQMT